ncbi:MAG: ABC transporter substrate-binding protein [Burkholderiaceae bacterium]
MKTTPPLLAGLAVAAACLGSAVQAQTLRFASQGDPQTMDPHSQNESFTNSVNQQVYEYLVHRDRQLNFVPGLATSWEQVSPLKWRFKLRQGVKFHDGSAFNADDVVYSIIRAQQPTSQIAVYANAVGTPKKIDDYTVEFDLPKVNPIFMEHVQPLFIMDKEWSEKNKATKPQDFKNKEEAYTALNANGTGPYMLVKREPGIKTTWKRNPNYWAKAEGNVQEVVFTPIGNDATRTAALVSGELDFILDPPPRDVARLRSTSGVKVIDGPENRIVFIGMDQFRDELQSSNVKGKNPFKDVRVRKALYQAVDIETMKTKLMNGQSFPTGGNTPSPKASFNDPKIESRYAFDLAEARRLMADAGYPQGFEVQLDCPNNRYINDEEICIALAGMWEKIGVKVRVAAIPRVTYFPKLEKFETSMYMLGWGGAVTDAETTLTPVMRNLGQGGIGSYNYGRSTNAKFDDLASRSSVEADPAKRKELIMAALTEWKEQVHTIPLHRQVIPWAARSNVTAVHRADNYLIWDWVTISK